MQVQNLVRLEKDSLAIQNFTTEQDDIVSYFSEIAPKQLPDELERVLRLGVVAAKTVKVAEKVDYVQKEFNKLGFKVKETYEQFESRVDEIFGEDGELSKLLEAHFGADGKLVKQIFDPTIEGTPLYRLRVEVERKLNELLIAMGIKEAEEGIRERTPLKGLDFEQRCSELLSRVAGRTGDEFEDVSNEPGRLPYSKKGDFVVTLGVGGGQRIVLEVKDVEQISMKALKATLDEAMENREASYAILAVKKANALPRSVGWFNEYGGDKLVCALGSEEDFHEELLQIAYRWARNRILSKVAEAEIDAMRIKNHVTTLQEKIEELKTIKIQCEAIENAKDEVFRIANRLYTEIGQELREILIAIK